MPDATFTFRVDETLKSAFNAAARAADRSAAQVLRAAMRDFVAAQAPPPPPPQAPPAAPGSGGLANRIAAARASLSAGRGYDDEEMKARFARIRAAARAALDQGQ